MRFIGILTATCIVVTLAAAGARAQGNVTDAARRRYEQASKSSNLDGVERSLKSDDPNERLKGLNDLTSLEDENSVDILLQALGDPDMRVRAKAIDTCADLRANAAVPVLIQQLFMAETSEPVKRRLLAALGKIGDPSAAKPIMDLLDQDLDPATRGTAIFALGDLGVADSLELLDGIAEHEDDRTIRRLASQAATKVRYAQTVRASEANQPLNTFLRPQQ
jgi:HEAT repeat protein